MRSIIVGTDFSKGSIVALELAIDIANKMNCDVSLIWVKREKMLMSEDQLNEMANVAQQKLVALCEKYRPRMLYGKIRWEICSGKVAAVIARQATHENAPLIVIGTNGASGFEKYWMGSTAVRIVQEAPVPVITVREGFDFHKDLERIVVPLRVNLNSRQKVAPAAAIAKLFHSEVHILGLIDDPSQAAQLRTYINQTATLLKNDGIKFSATVKKYSNYSDAVLSYAESVKADLVVINTEQDRIIAQLFLGTNAQQIVHNAQLPVMCVHPADIFFLSKS
ncbi:MAG: universal stress protein [Bacteroidales bacterium]|nr:universal stress protein [Bacteroidales bacterium]